MALPTAASIQCIGVTRRKERCKLKTAPGWSYCGVHKWQSPAGEEDPPSAANHPVTGETELMQVLKNTILESGLWRSDGSDDLVPAADFFECCDGVTTVLLADDDGARTEIQCATCFDEVDPTKAVSCAHRHSQCESCFDACVRIQSDITSQNFDASEWKSSRARVRCPFRNDDGSGKCACVFTELCVARHVTPETWSIYRKSTFEFAAITESQRAETRVLKRIVAEVQRASTISAADRQMDREYRRITEEIMTLKCPCGQAFSEFTGCMALACSRCEGDFCAACLKKFPTKRDCHIHVWTCPVAMAYKLTEGGTHYARADHYNIFQNRRRLDLAKEQIDQIKFGEIRNRLAIMLSKDFLDLGVAREDVERFADSILDSDKKEGASDGAAAPLKTKKGRSGNNVPQTTPSNPLANRLVPLQFDVADFQQAVELSIITTGIKG